MTEFFTLLIFLSITLTPKPDASQPLEITVRRLDSKSVEIEWTYLDNAKTAKVYRKKNSEKFWSANPIVTTTYQNFTMDTPQGYYCDWEYKVCVTASRCGFEYQICGEGRLNCGDARP